MKKQKRFVWTDKKVHLFTAIYSSNFCAAIVNEDIYFYSNYKGKKVKDKMKQFKKDYEQDKS